MGRGDVDSGEGAVGAGRARDVGGGGEGHRNEIGDLLSLIDISQIDILALVCFGPLTDLGRLKEQVLNCTIILKTFNALSTVIPSFL